MDQPRPDIQFKGFAPFYHLYTIDNWEQYEKYAKSNCSTWQEANDEAIYLGLNESDRIRLISARMLEKYFSLLEIVKDLKNNDRK